MNSRIKDCQIKWLQYLGRLGQNIIPNCMPDYKSRDSRYQETHVKDEENSFEFNSYNFKPGSWNKPLKGLKPCWCCC
jgi:hypothetical protein